MASLLRHKICLPKTQIFYNLLFNIKLHFQTIVRLYTHSVTLRQKIQTEMAVWFVGSAILDPSESFKVKKCFPVTFGLSSSFSHKFHYKMSNFSVPMAVSYTDLSVTVKSSLSFNTYIDDIVAKAFCR